MFDSDKTIKKALLSLAIEKTLLKLGPLVLQKVSERLFEEYNCYIPDCYEKPEYLRNVLKELYGKSYNEIVNSIQEEMINFVNEKKIREFLQVLKD